MKCFSHFNNIEQPIIESKTPLQHIAKVVYSHFNNFHFNRGGGEGVCREKGNVLFSEQAFILFKKLVRCHHFSHVVKYTSKYILLC
jgi:hypothetical protein